VILVWFEGKRAFKETGKVVSDIEKGLQLSARIERVLWCGKPFVVVHSVVAVLGILGG